MISVFLSCVLITRSITRCSAQNGLWTPTFFDFEHVQRGTLKKISEYGDFEHLTFRLWTCSRESTHCAHCARKNLVEHTMLGNQLRINETVATWSREIKIQLTLLITMSSHRLIWWRMAVLVTHNFFWYTIPSFQLFEILYIYIRPSKTWLTLWVAVWSTWNQQKCSVADFFLMEYVWKTMRATPVQKDDNWSYSSKKITFWGPRAGQKLLALAHCGPELTMPTLGSSPSQARVWNPGLWTLPSRAKNALNGLFLWPLALALSPLDVSGSTLGALSMFLTRASLFRGIFEAELQ